MSDKLEMRTGYQFCFVCMQTMFSKVPEVECCAIAQLHDYDLFVVQMTTVELRW